jgi:hypothetical protein
LVPISASFLTICWQDTTLFSSRKSVSEAINELLIMYFQESCVNPKTSRIYKYSAPGLSLFESLFRRISKYVAFEVLTTMAVAVALYSSVEVRRRFGGTYYLQFHSRRAGQELKQPEASSKQSLLG